MLADNLTGSGSIIDLYPEDTNSFIRSLQFLSLNRKTCVNSFNVDDRAAHQINQRDLKPLNLIP